MKRRLMKNRKTYEVTYDEYGYVDTVQNTDTGNFLSAKNAVVKSILANADRIRNGFIPKGFEKAR